MKTAVLIDGSNMYTTAKELGFNFDYRKVLELFAGHQTQAFYFTALPPKSEQSELRKMTDWLQYNGYTLITKQTKEWMQDDGSMKKKGNMDVEIAVHALRVCDYVDHIALWSGDGDFVSVVEECKNRGVHVSVYSSLVANMVADELRRSANKFFELAEFKDKIAVNPKFRVVGARK